MSSNPTVVDRPSGPSPELLFVNGAEQRRVALDHVPFTIGRNPDKNLVVTDARVSRNHAVIEADGADYLLVDVGSQPGTYVNGTRINRQKLNKNDRIEFLAKGGPYLIFDPTSAEQIQLAKEVNTVSRVSIFSRLNANDIEELSKILARKDFATDAAVFFQGEPSDSLYMVLKGAVKVVEASPEGAEKILDILGAGEIFGEIAMLDGHPRSASVITCEPSELACLSRNDFRSFVAKRPEVLWKVLESLCERIRKTSAGMVEMTSKEVPYRLIAALHQLAEKYGQVAADGSCLVSIKIGVQDLAGMVGANRETVARLLRQYEAEGLIELGKDKKLIIPDPAALTRALDYASEWS